MGRSGRNLSPEDSDLELQKASRNEICYVILRTTCKKTSQGSLICCAFGRNLGEQ